MSFTNQHLLILDGHGNHVTLEIITQAKELRLDTITLPSHTLQTLQPLYVFCFKPLKTTSKKIKNASMFRNNDMEPYKITLAGWVDQALEQSLKKNQVWVFKYRYMGFQPEGNGWHDLTIRSLYYSKSEQCKK
jgi:hypothetical protein